MSPLFIHVLNAEFAARDNGDIYDRPELALSKGVEGALAIAADEVRQGRTSSAIEVRIEHEDGTPLLRSVVTVAILPLITADGPAKPDVF